MNLNWSNRVIKYVLFIFNFIFVITGIIMMSIGVSVKAYYRDYDLFLGGKYFSLPNLLIAIGCLIFFISFFGCCGAMRENWLMILIFAVLLAIIFILEFSASIAGYVLRGDTSSYLSSVLKDNMDTYVQSVSQNKSDATVILWDFIQKQFECCGADKPEDWQYRFVNLTHNNYSLPVYCCKIIPGVIQNVSCELGKNDTAIPYTIGCVDGFGEYIKDHAVVIGTVGMIIAIVQLFGVIFAFHLSRRLKYGFYST